MSITRLLKKTDFYLTIIVLYLMFGMFHNSYIHFEEFRYWNWDMQLAGGLLLCVTGWKAYRLFLLKNKIIL